MSTLETNSIGKYSGNNVSIDDALNLKSYTTAERDALTSVAGDMIYNSTTGKVEHYNGTSWQSGVNVFELEYLIIAGGGAGGFGRSGPGVERATLAGALDLTDDGGAFIHSQTQAGTYTIDTNKGTVFAGPITITGRVTNNGTMVVV